MRDAIFILFVIFVLFGLTALRYRKQIAGMIGVARMIKDAKANRWVSDPEPSSPRYRKEHSARQLLKMRRLGASK